MSSHKNNAKLFLSQGFLFWSFIVVKTDCVFELCFTVLNVLEE